MVSITAAAFFLLARRRVCPGNGHAVNKLLKPEPSGSIRSGPIWALRIYAAAATSNFITHPCRICHPVIPERGHHPVLGNSYRILLLRQSRIPVFYEGEPARLAQMSHGI